MKRLKERHKVITSIILIITIIFLSKLFYIQVINKHYRFSANNNVLRYDVQQAVRGFIYDRDSNLIVTNVPFLENNHKDPNYKNSSLHNYFIERSFDLLKPGGTMLMMTSRYTLDSTTSSRLRKKLHLEGNVKAVNRLPNMLFSKSGASVITDIIVVSKKEKEYE